MYQFSINGAVQVREKCDGNVHISLLVSHLKNDARIKNFFAFYSDKIYTFRLGGREIDEDIVATRQ